MAYIRVGTRSTGPRVHGTPPFRELASLCKYTELTNFIFQIYYISR